MKENQWKSGQYSLYFLPCQLKSRKKFNDRDFVTEQGPKRLISEMFFIFFFFRIKSIEIKL